MVGKARKLMIKIEITLKDEQGKQLSQLEAVEDLVERVTGQRILSDQKIWEVVVNKAREISGQIEEEIKQIKSSITKEIEIAPTVDMYNSQTQEILLFDDAIGVKKQKDTRESSSATSLQLNVSEQDSSLPKKSRQTVNTDVVLLLKIAR